MKRKYAFFESILIAIIVISTSESFSQATLSPTGNINVCNPPGQITLTANLNNASAYLWSNGITTQSISVTTNGQYFCTVTDNNSVGFNSDTAFITINPVPIIIVDSTYGITCNGFQNGYISISGSGGQGPYSYSINGVNFLQSGLFQNLAQGSYTVTLKDNSTGCTSSSSFLINEPANLDVPYSSVNNSCFGNSSGTIDLQTTGGTLPYNFIWSNGSTNEDQSGLVAGTYTVVVTDFNGCIAENVIEVTEPGQLIIGKQFTNVSCANGADGTALISVNGGTPPYSYLWSNGETTDLAIGLNAGFHNVTITDQNGCVDVESFLITEPSALDAVLSSTDVSCFGSNDGTATVSPFGGTPYGAGAPYTIEWNTIPTQTGPTATGLNGGTYVSTITDSTGCTKYIILTIDEPDAISINMTSNNPSCFGGFGEATALASGGTGSYSYAWSTIPIQTTNTASGLLAGSYTVIVTDSKGCTSSSSVNISNPVNLVVTPTIVDVGCNGGNNGQINLSISPNNGGYSFLWNTNPTATTSGLSGLAAGSYTVIISYGNGCTFSATYVISQPSVLNCNSSFTNVTCNAGNNGTASVNPTGGTAPYSVLWSNGSTNNSISGLIAGNYTVTITDSKGCVSHCNFSITENSPITISSLISNATCFGSLTGSINLTVSGGSGTYSYLWSNGNTTNSVGNLAAGTYVVTVTDANSCTNSLSVTITQPSELSCVCNSNVTNVSCFGGNNGQITVLPFGGTQPYSYAWSNGQSTQTISGLVAGTYTVTISDANGCARIGIVQVIEPQQLFAAISCINNVTCSGSGNGSACVSGIGGTPPYSYSWSTIPVQTTFTATGLVAGTYIATITDSKGCTATASVTIAQPNSTVSCTVAKNDVACFGQSTGNATVTALGGAGNYSYLWNTIPAKTSQTALGLAAGIYVVTVTDSNGCSSSCSVTINQPAQMVALYQTTNIACNAGNDGAIDVTATGGTTPYTYLWSNGATTEDLSGIAAGVYVVTITDIKGCAIGASIVVSQPNLINISKTKTNVTCYNSNNGSATVTVTNGVAPYSYIWSNGEISAVISNLAAGVYTVTVTDANGCTKSTSVSITQPASFTCSIAVLQQVQCNGNNGMAQVSTTGGIAPFTYSWTTSPVQTNSVATGLSPGTYLVIITDSHGCTSSCNVSLIGTTALSCNTSGTNVSCNGGNDGSASVTATGGTAPYSYLWNTFIASTNSSVSGLSAGTYSVIVTDATGCTSICSVIVSQPTAISLSLSSTVISCNGGSNGTATANAAGGTPSYSYLWSDGQSTQTALGLVSGAYSVTVTDSKGCSVSQQITLSNPALLSCNIIGTDATCFGNSNGSAHVTATGGSGNLSYLWSTVPPQFTSTATGLSAGIYYVTVTDIKGCTSSCSVQINSNSQLSCSITGSNNPGCYAGSNGDATVTASGGTGSYNYLWSTTPTQTTAIATGLSSGIYNVIITDGQGCSAICSVLLTNPAELGCSISSTNTSCGLNNGFANVNVSGGTPGYTFIWSNGTTSQNNTGLGAGSYTVTVTDSKGCSSFCNVSIAASNAILITTSKTNASCNGTCDGKGNVVTITGGVAPYNYLWSDGQTVQNATGLCAIIYTVTVTDINGCSATKTISITQPVPLNISFTNLQNVSCNGGNNGSAKVITSGGTAPYSYLWSNGNTAQTATGLVAGIYTVTVTDSKGCSGSASMPISEPSAIVVFTQSQNVLCKGSNSGSSTAIVSGGTGGFNFNWNSIPSQTNQTATNLYAGTYIVTVTDANGCSKTASAIVTEPSSSVSCSISSISPTCFGGNNGSATITPSGGTPGYTYLWNNGNTNSTLNNIPAGVYSATVTDFNGCTSSCAVTVTNLAALSCSISKTDVSCNEGSNGTALISPAGGTPPYTYLWSNGQTNQSISALPAGIYTATVTDFNNCTSICDVLILQPNAIDISFSNIITATCGNSNASAMANSIGGTAGYSFLWSNSQGGSVITNSPAGTYTVTVTDFNGCTASKSLIINGTSTINLIISSIPINCFGESSGSASVIASGGNGIYNYLWSTIPNQTTSTATGLVVGNYQVFVSDPDGCTATASTNVIQSPLLTCSTSSTLAPCGSNTGSATVLPNGGTPAYSYLWSNGKTTSTITGLGAGTYTITVTDSKGCSSVCSIIVDGGPKITTISTQLTKVSCFGGSDGSACVTGITGGVSPYFYHWSNGSTSTCATGLSVGSYTITVTDKNGCTKSKTVSITQSPVLSCSTTAKATGCGLCNGTATVTAVGGTPVYTYQWSTVPVQTTKKATGLCSGVYNVIVTDANQCTSVCSANIGASSGIASVSIVKTNVSCFGGNNGAATATPIGGTAPYTYLWSNGKTTQTTTGLIASVYTVTVTGKSGCTNTASVTIAQPTAVSCSINGTNSTCGLANGSALASALGGTSPFTYLWNTGSTNIGISNLSAGTYSVTITDQNGCSSSCSQIITGVTALTISINPTNVQCFGGSTGSATAIVNGGTQPYSYLWSNGQTGATATGLSLGAYSVTATDLNGCSIQSSTNINQPTILSCSTSSTQTICSSNSGTASVVASGGTSAYSYLWSNGATNSSISGLADGTYTVSITDIKGCTSSCSAVVTTLYSNISVTLTPTNVKCFGGNDGSICATNISGGNLPYSYLWSNGQTSSCISGLTAGFYTVTVTDVNGCSKSQSNQVSNNPLIVLSTSSTPATCGNCNGTATASVSGGVSGYTYNWSTTPVQTGSTATGLCYGSYTIQITDNVGCTSTKVVQVTGDTTSLSCYVNILQNISCFGGTTGSISVSATGSTAPYTYLWSNGETGSTISNLPVGTYTVTVTSFYNCTSSCSVSLTSPLAITNSFAVDSVSSWCNTDGSVSASVSGGSPAYQYLWSTGETTSSINNVYAGVYSLTVTDNNGCIYFDSVNVYQPTFACNTFMSGHTPTYWNPGPGLGKDTLSKYLDANFSTVYPTGMVLKGTCPGAFSLTFTSAAAVKAFLPSKNKTNPLTQNWINPLDTPLNNNLAAQLVTLKLNIDFDLQNPNFAPTSTVNFQNLVIDSGPLTGTTVKQLFDMGRNFLSGCGATVTGNFLRTYVSVVNSSWNLGIKSNNVLKCPTDVCSPSAKAVALSIDEFGLTAYPNPTDGVIHLNFDLSKDLEFKISLYDLAGRIIDNRVYNGLKGYNEVNLDYSNLPKGMYLLNFDKGNGSRVIRIVIQ